MISITLECSCGQEFVFDVEPVDGRMSTTVACPACGLDATEVGNEEIERQLTSSAPPARWGKKDTLMIVGAFGVGLVLLGLAGGAFVWWKSHSEKPPTPEMALSAEAAVPATPKPAASTPAAPVPAAPTAAPSVPAAPTTTSSEPSEPAAPIAHTTPGTAVKPSTVDRDPSFVGVGALFDPDTKTDYVKIAKVLANSPAKKAGIVAGDLLISIEDTPIKGLSSKDIADMFFGPVGSKVTMQLISSQTGQTNRLEMVRKKYH